jgi:hypothetical protein
MHLHACDPQDGRPTAAPELFMEFLPRIQQHTEAVCNITTGGSLKMSLEERLAAPRRASPEVAYRFSRRNWNPTRIRESVSKKAINGGNSMECCSTIYALALVPDLDYEEFRRGQLIAVTCGLSIALIVNFAMWLLT